MAMTAKSKQQNVHISVKKICFFSMTQWICDKRKSCTNIVGVNMTVI